mmetsp:Transcript_19504/g.66894  ORF Transcript_19504/g.66894 Transcript_19504/m.66894 type:complete len:243 (+) Transcript_19504:2127-2855(+)
MPMRTSRARTPSAAASLETHVTTSRRDSRASYSNSRPMRPWPNATEKRCHPTALVLDAPLVSTAAGCGPPSSPTPSSKSVRPSEASLWCRTACGSSRTMLEKEEPEAEREGRVASSAVIDSSVALAPSPAAPRPLQTASWPSIASMACATLAPQRLQTAVGGCCRATKGRAGRPSPPLTRAYMDEKSPPAPPRGRRGRGSARFFDEGSEEGGIPITTFGERPASPRLGPASTGAPCFTSSCS